jgi:hypothetical protein
MSRSLLASVLKLYLDSYLECKGMLVARIALATYTLEPIDLPTTGRIHMHSPYVDARP